MSDSTSVSFPVNPDDKRPLPEIIAELANFPLAYHDLENGTRLYAVRDWMTGILNSSNPRTFWAIMKRRNPDLKSLCIKLPYKASDMKNYKTDFVDAASLISITKNLKGGIGIVNQILEGTYAKHKMAGVVYLFSIKEMPGYYKIGKTKNVQQRLSGYNTAVPLTIVLEYAFEHIDYELIEKKFHRAYRHKRVKGEWFLLTPDDISQIRSIFILIRLTTFKRQE